jgi:1,2-diacylglycerol 3-alpha-glucosyltransferase
MKKLHIAIVTNNYRPYKGGVVSSIETFTQQLLKVGHKVSIITLDFTGKNNHDTEYIYRIRCPIKFNYKTNPIAIPWFPNLNVIKKIEELKPDIIHSQHPFLLGISALKASKKFKIPIIFTYHTRYEEYAHYIPFPTKLSVPIIKKLALNYCKNVDAIIAPTKSTSDFLKENGINKSINIIPSGISDIFIKNEDKKNEQFKDLKKNTIFKLLTVSRFTKEKNIPFLLDVLSKLNSKYHLTLAGYGGELEFLKNYAFNHLKLNRNQIEFINSPTKNALLKAYKTSDIFIFASKTETQGIVLAEAMACGLPIIALNGPGACDIVYNRKNGFLVNSKEEMVEKIKYLQNACKLKNDLGKNARKTALRYTINQTTNRLINLYKQLL